MAENLNLKFRWGPWRIEQAISGELDVNLLDRNGFGALHECIYKQKTNDFEKLIKIPNVDLNLTTSRLSTPAHFAAEVENQYYLKRLLELGANPNRQDRDRQTPLIIATESKNADAVSLLLSFKAETKYADRRKLTAYDIAINTGQVEVARLLEGKPGCKHWKPTTRLLWAVVTKQWRVIPYLAERGANLHAKAPDGRSVQELAELPRYDFGESESINQDHQKTTKIIRDLIASKAHP